MRGLTLNKLSFARGENVHLLHDTKHDLVVCDIYVTIGFPEVLTRDLI